MRTVFGCSHSNCPWHYFLCSVASDDSPDDSLLLMVVLSGSHVQHLERKAITKALTIQIQPKTIKRYVDDSHTNFPSKLQTNTFQEILNKQDPAIQDTIKYENGNKSLNFLDINITNTINNKYVFKVHRKKAITNVHINNQRRVSILTSSKVYSTVFFTEHTRYVSRNI